MNKYIKDKREVIISKEKIICVIKKNWWIMVLSLISACILMLVIPKKNSSQDTENTSSSEQTTTVASTTSTKTYYQAYAEVFVHQNLEEIYPLTINYNVYDYNTITNSVSTMDKINEKLVENGYEKLNSNDNYVSSVYTDNIIAVSATGYDYDRAILIVDTLAEYIVERGNEVFKEGNAYVLNKAGAYTLSSDGKRRTYGGKVLSTTEQTITNNTSVSAEDNSDLMNIEDETSNNNEIDVKRILAYIIGGLLLGAVVLFFIVVLDKTIYTVADMSNITNLPLLGKVTKKNTIEDIALAISVRLGENKNTLIIMNNTQEDAPDAEKLIIELEASKVNAKISTLNESETVREINKYDSVILYVQKGIDKIDLIDISLNKLSVTDAKVMGYILG